MVAIKIVASANMAQVQSQFAAVTAQVAAMNKELARTALIPQGGTPAGFAGAARSANAATQAFNHALASSGAYRVEQLKINDAVSKTTEQLGKQKLAMNEVFGRKNSNAQKMMSAVYREQLALQQAIARVPMGGISDGKTRMSLGVPTQVTDSWDTLNNRIGFFRTRLASASAEMVNWGKNTQWAGRQLMAGISMPVAAFGAAAGVMAYQVDKELTRIAKVYDTTADQNSTSISEMAAAEKELAGVRAAGMETAKGAASAYGASVTDTLAVQAELAATGQAGARLQESTNEVMRIATLGEIDHAAATKALISLQAVLGHTVKQTADDFNYMNSIENATSLSTDDFVAAIPRALGPMKEMGGSLQDLAVLMVAMKERGIEAGEGANAIKSMMQRLYRPSEQVRGEWEKLAGVDPMKFVEESGGRVMEILPRIADATKDLDRASRVKLLSGLFGTYQVTRMSAMLKGLDDMKNGIGQTSRVMEVNAQSAEENAKIAAGELATQAESAAGRFKRAWEGMRAQLADLGPPFLDVASKFLELAQIVLKFVNDMPGWAKKGLIFGAMIAALVGPVVMLIGLFANFAGNIGKFIATSLKLVTSFEFLNKSQVAARISASLAESAFVKQASSAQILEKRMLGVAEATELAARAQILLMQSQGVNIKTPVGYQPGHGAAAPAVPHGPQLNTNQLAIQQAMAGMQDKNGRYREGGKFISMSTAQMKAEQAHAQAMMKANGQVALTSAATADAEHAAARSRQSSAQITQKVKDNTGGIAAGTAVAAAAMGTMMFSSNETANSLAQMALVATMVVPAMQGLGPVLKAAAEKGKVVAATQLAAAKNAATMAGGTAKAAGMINVAKSGLKGLAAGFLGVMGPIGWTVTALAAVGVIAYKMHEAREKAIKEEIKYQSMLNDTTKDWAGLLDVGIKKQKSISALSMTSGNVTTMSEELVGTESGKALVDEYKAAGEAGDTNKQSTLALSQYVQILRTTEATSMQARKALEAMFVAAGDGAIEAQRKAFDLQQQYGSFDTGDLKGLWTQRVNDAIDGDFEVANEVGKQIGQDFASALVNATAAERPKVEAALQETFTGGWDEAFTGLSGDFKSTLSDFGVNSGKELAALTADWQKVLSEEMTMDEFELKFGAQVNGTEMIQFGTLLDGTNKSIENLRESEKGVAQEMAEQLGLNQERIDNIKTLADLQNTYEYAAETARKSEMKDLYKKFLLSGQIQGFLGMALGGQREMSEESKLAYVNKLREAQGWDRVTSLAGAFKKEVKDGADEAKRLKDEVDNIKPVVTVDIRGDQLGGIIQSGMTGVQDEIAQVKIANFEANMNAATTANDNYWDNAISSMQASQDRASEAMSKGHEMASERLADAQERASESLANRQEAASDKLARAQEATTARFDALWERRTAAVEKAYDARIEKVEDAIEAEQKAEEIRQRIFAAEQSRLDRLTESANRTIDFNMALQTGELDEAAKIRNDMDAAAQEWALSDAADRGARGSDKRQAKLQDRTEALGEKKDAALIALEKREEAERASLERRLENQQKALEKSQEMEKKSLENRQEYEQKSLENRQEAEQKHLEKVQEMNMKALNTQADKAKETFRNEWENRRDSLDRQLELFKSFVPKNQKQLEKWMDEMNISYKNFGDNKLHPKAETWGKWFKSSLKDNIRQAGAEVASSNQWENVGAKTAEKMLRGMGFGSIGQFENFIRTGKLPGDFGSKRGNGDAPGGNPYGGSGPAGNGNYVRHEGGFIGGSGGKNSRKGVARTQRGLHSSEAMVLAQKGEFMVNRDSAKKHAGLLDAVNSGKDISPNTSRHNIGRGTGGSGSPGMGFAGLMSGIIGTMFARGVANSIQGVTEKKVSAAQSMMGAFGNIKAGQYGDTFFNAEQLKNASTIASVGKTVGASSRDIIIALMTAMQESTLRNLDWGDRDSVGLFQQRDPWGSFAQRTDPATSAKMFFTGGFGGQPGLFDYPGRDSMSMGAAAQAVQVSAYPDAYTKWADEAQAILSALKSSASRSGGFVDGPGGLHKPSVPGKGWRNSHDYANGEKSPLYAWSDGVVTSSKATTSGGSPGNGLYRDPISGRGYTSYGENITIRGNGGSTVLYAHLAPGQRYVQTGDRVKGGALIGLSGSTGNSSGFHTHFTTNGNYNAQSFFESRGIPLKTGGTVKYDDTPALLHKDERVLTAPLTSKLDAGIDAIYQATRNAGASARPAPPERQYPLPGTKPWVYRAGQYLGNKYDVPTIYGVGSRSGVSDHPSGHALDFMTYSNVDKGNKIATEVRNRNADFDASYVIWRQRIASATGGWQNWRAMEDRGSPTANHMDHVHVSFKTTGDIGDLFQPTGNSGGGGKGPTRPPKMSYEGSVVRPGGNKGKNKSKDKGPTWSATDKLKSSAESWGKETTKVDLGKSSPFWTYADTINTPKKSIYDTITKAERDHVKDLTDTGAKAEIRLGTLNTYVGTAATKTISDLKRLTPNTDFLMLTEMANKFDSVKKWLGTKDWGLLGGKTRDQKMSALAYNKKTQKMERSGMKKLGGKRGDFVGGREDRYANYGLFTDRDSGQKTWQISAHTVPTPIFDQRHRELFYEQWGNLNDLVKNLRESGNPVFVGGDLNNNPNRDWWKKPEGLNSFSGAGVDWIFSDPKLVKRIGERTLKGMHSDHGAGAQMANFSIPSRKDGAENIRWDNTLVNMHKKESILTADQSDKFRKLANNIDNVAGGGGNEYNVNVYMTGTDVDADDVANKVMTKIRRIEDRKPTRRRS